MGSRLAVAAIAAVVFTSGPPWRPAAGGETGPAIFPPGSTVRGKTLGEWSGEWWRWVISLPKDKSPVTDPDGRLAGEGQGEEVFFLAGTFGGEGRRSCSVPFGREIFFPIVNDLEWAPTVVCSNCDGCHVAAAQFVDKTAALACEVDGEPVTTVWDHRERSGCTWFEATPNNVFDIPKGRYEPAYSDGYWLMLGPPSLGEHTIRFRGVVGPEDNPIFLVEMTYEIAVEHAFRRGDASADGVVDLSDPIRILERLFLGGAPLDCEDAADANDDGAIDLSDPIHLLTWLFLAGPAPPSPGPDGCGGDPISDALAPCAPTCGGGGG